MVIFKYVIFAPCLADLSTFPFPSMSLCTHTLCRNVGVLFCWSSFNIFVVVVCMYNCFVVRGFYLDDYIRRYNESRLSMDICIGWGWACVVVTALCMDVSSTFRKMFCRLMSLYLLFMFRSLLCVYIYIICNSITSTIVVWEYIRSVYVVTMCGVFIVFVGVELRAW